MISGVILVNMKTLWYRMRRQWLYVLPGHCAILTQLYALRVYVHAPVLLQSLNRRSLAGPLNVITGSSEPLTDTCWGQGMTQGPPQKNLITAESDIWEWNWMSSLTPSSLHTPLCQCASKRANSLKTNGHPFFFYLSVPLLKFRGALPPVKC